MTFVTALAIGLYAWVAGLGLGPGAALVPARAPGWVGLAGPASAPVARPADPNPRRTGSLGARGGPASGASAAVGTARLVEPLARRRDPVLGDREAPARGPLLLAPPAPAPPPGSFMTQADYERAISGRLAREHPELRAQVRLEIARAVSERALAWGLSPWLVYADIRVESDFDASTRGAAGEIGLMQVLPSTARMVARRVFGIDDFPAERLYDPGWNVRIGTAFLGSLMEQHRGNLGVALAAYNAGGGVAGPTAYTYRVLGVYRRVSAGPTGNV